MGKTATERQRDRRQRLRENPQAYEKYKEADRIRKQIGRSNMTPAELRKLREKTRIAVQRHRHPVHQQYHEDGTEYKYGNRAALCKAKSKVLKALPVSPRKRKTIMKSLACDILDAYVVNIHPNRISQHTIDMVVAFYEDDAVSRMSPGKADCISIHNSMGNKVKKQKRHLVMTLSEAYNCFKEDHPEIKIGKSKFASLRPQWVFLSSQTPQNVCGCRYHENVFLMLEALHRKFPDVVPLYSKEKFTAKCKCDPDSEICMSENCDTCSESKLFTERFRDKVIEEPVFKWYQWKEVGFLQKTPIEGSTNEAFDELSSQLPKFFWHSYLKDKQAASYNRSKASAKEPVSNVCLLQMDFAENFTCLWQNEIQSAHWRQRQVTIYTVMVYHRQQTLSLVIVSDYREHEKCAVAAFTSQALDVIKKEFPTVEMVDIWSDGPSSQFKNKYVFVLLSKLQNHHGLTLKWNYFATSHGKGPNDGLGGNVKRMARRLIMTNAKMITDAETFVEGIQSCQTDIHLLVMNQDAIEQQCQALGTDALWDGIQTFQGTITTHCLEALEEKTLRLRYYTDAVEYRDVPKSYANSAVEEAPPSTSKNQDDEITTGNHSSEHVKEPDAGEGPSSKASKTTKNRKRMTGSRQKRKVQYESSNKCGLCGVVYGDPLDHKSSEDWVMCQCKVWFHETCGEDYGIIDDDGLYTCTNCL